MNVAAWLASLGLETYIETFAAHGVDGEVLPLLRAEDLRDLGIAAVGHRRKMLAALTRLRESEGLWRTGAPVDTRTAGRLRSPCLLRHAQHSR